MSTVTIPTERLNALESAVREMRKTLAQMMSIVAPKSTRPMVTAAKAKSVLKVDNEGLRAIRRTYPHMVEERRDSSNKPTGKYLYAIDELKAATLIEN